MAALMVVAGGSVFVSKHGGSRQEASAQTIVHQYDQSGNHLGGVIPSPSSGGQGDEVREHDRKKVAALVRDRFGSNSRRLQAGYIGMKSIPRRGLYVVVDPDRVNIPNLRKEIEASTSDNSNVFVIRSRHSASRLLRTGRKLLRLEGHLSLEKFGITSFGITLDPVSSTYLISAGRDKKGFAKAIEKLFGDSARVVHKGAPEQY